MNCNLRDFYGKLNIIKFKIQLHTVTQTCR